MTSSPYRVMYWLCLSFLSTFTAIAITSYQILQSLKQNNQQTEPGWAVQDHLSGALKTDLNFSMKMYRRLYFCAPSNYLNWPAYIKSMENRNRYATWTRWDRP